MEHIHDRSGVPVVSIPVDADPMPSVPSLVAPFRLVWELGRRFTAERMAARPEMPHGRDAWAVLNQYGADTFLFIDLWRVLAIGVHQSLQEQINNIRLCRSLPLACITRLRSIRIVIYEVFHRFFPLFFHLHGQQTF